MKVERGRWRTQMRRPLEPGVVGACTFEEWIGVLDAAGWCCLCGGAYERMDHIEPIVWGGSHAAENLRPMCQMCHDAKTAWERRQGGRRAAWW